MLTRVVLFLVTNLAIVLVLSVTMRLGVEPYLAGGGLDLTALLVFAATMGFIGSLMSLAMSKWMAKKAVGARIISEPGTEEERWLLETVRAQSAAAGIRMPEVAIWESSDVNAFATGRSRNNSLVAVSTGLLRSMTRDEAGAVLGHEIAHVANGDMVTLALIQGVVNTFVLFLSRIVGHVIDKAVFRNERGTGPAFYVSVLVAELVLGILASLIVMWFSRWREFRADEGGARLAGRSNMVSALRRLQAVSAPTPLPDKIAAFGVDGGKRSGLTRLFSTHPPLADRIAALERGATH